MNPATLENSPATKVPGFGGGLEACVSDGYSWYRSETSQNISLGK
jgi:hypothetical protein